MKRKVHLLSLLAILAVTLACSGETYAVDPAGNARNDTIMADNSANDENDIKTYVMNIKIGDKVLTATLVDNSSVQALTDALSEGPITVNMRDYGNMEKVGSLGRSFPRNDESITTKPGDIILYQGNALVIYYAPNSWSFTRLGSIDDITPEELMEVLGKGSVTVTLSLPQD